MFGVVVVDGPVQWRHLFDIGFVDFEERSAFEKDGKTFCTLVARRPVQCGASLVVSHAPIRT